MLNKSQQTAYQQIKAFLLNPDQKYLTLSAAAGYGKSFLLNHIYQEWNSLQKARQFLQLDGLEQILFACTTNKAATVLKESVTVHKMFGLVPKNNYKTGETTTVTTARTKDIGNNLLIIDEASMLEPLVLKYIDENTSQAKVILVGDDHQLPPVKCRSIPAFSNGFPTCTLTEPMRQDKDSHLFKELMKLREAVTNKEFYAPQEGEGITYLDGIQFKDAFLDSFRNQEDARLLAYANKTVEQYNGFIRKTLHGTDFFEVGDIVVAANCCNEKTKVEGTYRVEAVSENIHKGFVPYRHVTLDDGYCYQTPVDKQEYFKIIKRFEKEAKQDGRWSDYFELKGNYLDIRDGFACTVNKSQGSTYDKVFIDLQNISQCRDPYTLTRLIYVAFSRAKKEVIIYRG